MQIERRSERKGHGAALPEFSLEGTEDAALVVSAACLARAGGDVEGWRSLGASAIRGRDQGIELFAPG